MVVLGRRIPGPTLLYETLNALLPGIPSLDVSTTQPCLYIEPTTSAKKSRSLNFTHL